LAGSLMAGVHREHRTQATTGYETG
jgi:hypothetical protein